MHEGGEGTQVHHAADDVVEDGDLRTPVNRGYNSSPCEVACRDGEVELAVRRKAIDGILHHGGIWEEKMLDAAQDGNRIEKYGNKLHRDSGCHAPLGGGRTQGNERHLSCWGCWRQGREKAYASALREDMCIVGLGDATMAR